MKTYTLPISWVQSGLIKISADSLNEAVDTLNNLDLASLAVVGATVPNTTRVVYTQLASHVPDEYLTNIIRLYISSKMPNCPHCDRAKEYLKENNIKYEEIDLATDSDARTYVRGRTGSLAVPQIEVGNELLRGFNPDQLEAVLGKYGD